MPSATGMHRSRHRNALERHQIAPIAIGLHLLSTGNLVQNGGESLGSDDRVG